MSFNKRTSIVFITSGIILTAMFCFILIFNVGNYVEVKSYTDSAEEITAICKECFTHTQGDNEEYFISVDYTWDSQTLTAEDLAADRKYSRDEEVTIYVSKDNPSDVRLTLPESRFNTVSIVIMIPFMILGVILIVVGAKTLKDN